MFSAGEGVYAVGVPGSVEIVIETTYQYCIRYHLSILLSDRKSPVEPRVESSLVGGHDILVSIDIGAVVRAARRIRPSIVGARALVQVDDLAWPPVLARGEA